MGRQIGLLIEQLRRQSDLQVGINARSSDNAEKENIQVFGTPCPQTFLSPRTAQGDDIIGRAHTAARKEIKAICPDTKVGITFSLHDMQFDESGREDADRAWKDEFSHYLPYICDDDFVGVQNYTRSLFGGLKPTCPLTQMGYENYPEALPHVVRRVYEEAKLPILVTENGIATSDDKERQRFIDKVISGVTDCCDEGIPVLGYLHWSLLDNFEWQKGYEMTFGLVQVDRKTLNRVPKDSLRLLGSYRIKESE